jgi:hypothetical protein
VSYDENKKTNNFTVEYYCCHTKMKKFGNIFKFLEINGKVSALIQPFSTANIKFNESKKEIKNLFENIHKFFRKIEFKEPFVLIDAMNIITKCIIMTVYETEKKVKIVTQCVDLNEHD